MLPDGVRRLIRDFSVKPGERAIVLGSDDETLAIADELAEVGIDVVKVLDLRDARPRELVARGRQGSRATARPRRRADRLRPPRRVGRPAARVLAPRPGRRARRVRRGARRLRARRSFRAGVEAVGSVTGEGLSRIAPEPAYPGKGKCFVCICEDVTTKDMKRAIGEGFDSIELAKRYTTTTMGPCQGKLCHLVEHPRVRAGDPDVRDGDRHDDRAAAVVAGRARPARRTRADAGAARLDPLAARGGRRDDPVGGPWKRPYAYGENPEDEVRAVHESLGVIDVSTLGQALRRRARGRRAARAALPEPLRRHEAGPHPLRRPHLGRRPDHGRRHRSRGSPTTSST